MLNKKWISQPIPIRWYSTGPRTHKNINIFIPASLYSFIKYHTEHNIYIFSDVNSHETNKLKYT